MNRFWSILFLLVPVGGLASFLLAAHGIGPLAGAWLPENFSQSGKAIDELFYLVHWICAFIFLLTGFLLAGFVWKYSATRTEPALFTKGNVRLELVWSIIPAAILIALATYQMKAWSEQRVDRPTIQVGHTEIEKPPTIRIIAKQFGWEFHYPGKDQRFDTLDDFFVENLMVVPDDETTVLRLESIDVIHSFFVPKLRLKHDVVPGMVQYAWFRPTGIANMNILCAELCGWGHYKMNAELRIVDRDDYQDWLTEQQQRIAPPELAPFSKSAP